MRRILLLCLLIALCLPTIPARAQTDVRVVDIGVDHLFNSQIIFTGRLTTREGVGWVELLFRDPRDPFPRSLQASIQDDGRLEAIHTITPGVLRPFVPLDFQFVIHMDSGALIPGETFSYTYSDNRFAWNSVQEGMVTVHWYDPDPAFGLAALNAARQGQENIAAILPLALTSPVQIYVYSSTDALRSALGGQDWVAGHASVDLGVILVSVTPGEIQDQLLLREVPHELTHMVLYQYFGERYASIPVWLREGLAVMSQEYADPDRQTALINASQRGGLLPIAGLCEGFPPDASRAFLAYAQAASFTGYLFDTIGSVGVFTLLSAYADGQDCETGAALVTGRSLTRLDALWREDVLGQNPAGAALRRMLPYVLLLLVALAAPLIGLIRGRRSA